MPVCLLKSSLQTALTHQYDSSHNVYYVKSRIWVWVRPNGEFAS